MEKNSISSTEKTAFSESTKVEILHSPTEHTNWWNLKIGIFRLSHLILFIFVLGAMCIYIELTKKDYKIGRDLSKLK